MWVGVQAILMVSSIFTDSHTGRNYAGNGTWGQRQGSFPGTISLEEAHGKCVHSQAHSQSACQISALGCSLARAGVTSV